WGQLHTRAPHNESSSASEDERRHVSVLPLEVRGRDGLLIHGDETSELWTLLAEYGSRDQQMPVAVVLGGAPINSVASWAPLPSRTDALTFAGFLRSRPVELVSARSVPLTVPAAAEIIIEGYVDPQSAFESGGPISRETGFLGPNESLP